ETLELRTRSSPELDFSDYSLPGKLTRIVERCLAVRPDDRYQTVDELNSALQRFVEETATADQASSIFLIPKSVQEKTDVDRRKVKVIVGSLLIVGVVAMLLVPQMQSKNEKQQVEELDPVKEVSEAVVLSDVMSNGIEVRQHENSHQQKAYELAGVSEKDSDAVKIGKLESYRKSHAFSYPVCNELRHLYNRRNSHKSMELCNLILKNVPADEYTLKILSEWKWQVNDEEAVAELEKKRRKYADLKFLAASCTICIADTVSKKDRAKARRYYEEVAGSSSPDMEKYRELADTRLAHLQKLADH
ncbi:MAG: hypothetical protein K2Z81_21545, partial [Cyanobacteria bacterium]|nr:hypothetical protein [Cyanobacteriota bacterium]